MDFHRFRRGVAARRRVVMLRAHRGWQIPKPSQGRGPVLGRRLIERDLVATMDYRCAAPAISASDCAGATALVGWSIDYIAPLEAEQSGRRPRFFVRMWRESRYLE